MPIYESLADADDATRDRADEVLRDDEALVMVVRNQSWMGAWLESAVSMDWLLKLTRAGKRVALTDERVVEFQVNTVRDVDEYQLDAISAVSLDEGPRSEVAISGSGFDEEFTVTDVEEAERFADAIRQEIRA
jgi:hypothetical protein